MDTLLSIIGNMLFYTYHCFDRIVINGYLSMLSRAENVAYFFHNVVGEPCITKEVLSARTNHYSKWVEAFARNHDLPVEWAEKGVRKEEYVRPYLQAMQQKKDLVYTSFSRAWNNPPRSVPSNQNIRLMIRIIGF